MELSRKEPMSSPFGIINPIGQPSWSAISVNNGNFTKVNVTGQANIPEVGYGEGGYGEDGYDTPTQVFPSASTPNWTTVLTK